jgi:hypothetical protein
MKKTLTIIALSAVFTFGAEKANAQAASQLNIGFVGVNYEIPIATDISIAPAAYTNWNFDWLQLGVKANYYFDNVFGLTEPWDVYAGVNVGYALGLNNNGNDFGFGLQVGGRWFWSDKWGVYLEAGGGNIGAMGGVGVTMKM